MDDPIHKDALRGTHVERTSFVSTLSHWSRSPKIKIFTGTGVVFFVVAIFIFFLTPPVSFPVGERVTIEEGVSLGQVSIFLKEKQIIRSRTVFEFCMIVIYGDKNTTAGDYLFKESMNACTVASRIARGISGMPAIKVTIPEGMSNIRVAEVFEKTLSKFDSQFFIKNTQRLEGYLFPETYFFSPHATAGDVMEMMNAQFQKKIEPLMSLIENSEHSLEDIVIMASILEKEAKTPEDQALVSGILWKRIARGMPLQVDAPFYYLLGKKSDELTQSDLKMESGYNTYKNKGLPVGPIGNPGMVAIRAAIFPMSSPYWYYLSDKDDVIHYAKTFDEHKTNKARYLYK